MQYGIRTDMFLAYIVHVSMVSNLPECHIEHSKENTKAKMWNTMRSSADEDVDENGY